MHPDREFGPPAGEPTCSQALIADLELDTLLGAMAAGDEFLLAVARAALLAGLRDPAAIRYRQQVLADCLREAPVVRRLYEIAAAAIAGERRAYGGWFLPKAPDALLRRSVEVLQMFTGHLRQLREIAARDGPRLSSAGFTRLFAMLLGELTDEYFAEIAGHLRRLRFRDGVLISARLGAGNRGTGYTLRRAREPRRRLALPPARGRALTLTIADRDEAGARALAELERRGINLVADALARSTDHILAFFTALRTELAFYVGALNLHEALTARGVPLCFPEPAGLAGPGPLFTARDLREPCLALTAPEPVAGNDVDADGRPLIVITGANQGGKSTFLRSVGVAHLMMEAGLYVPARALRATVSRGVFTHFRREEDATMTSGKLDEELRRMSQVTARIAPGALLLCNESFAATNEREGSQIAREVFTALLDCGVRLCAVTHLFDLAHGLHAERGAGALFLRAERGADGRRTFRLVPAEPLPTSFGEDIYRRMFGERAAAG